VATPVVLKQILRQEFDLLLEKLRRQTVPLAASQNEHAKYLD
jgi:hypothetical protein